MTHTHITAWALALILFFIALGLHKTGKHRGFKTIHMILRVFYLFIIATGIELLVRFGLDFDTFIGMYWIKTIVGILVIAFFEMVLVSIKKGRPAVIPWALLVISFVTVVYLGFHLPLGF